MRIALTGNPNSGKTTMYNALTGRNEKIGNWAGVTVDKKEYPVKKDHYWMYECCTDEKGEKYGWGRVLDYIGIGWEDIPNENGVLDGQISFEL